ncbi:MAG: M12 family metallo-peptidase [Myroides odoratus]|jgi:hypothetical protein|nr:M12 family metallo-peptidase [Myroides odoratus]
MKKIFILFVWCLGLSALGQENLIYQQIQNEKLNGEKFTPVQGAFKPDKLDPTVAKEFKNSKEVDFFQFDAKAISHKERSFSLDLPLHNKTMTLELVAVDDSFYDYEVVIDKGKTIPANRNIKHYRGVIKGDPQSLVAISFFENEMGGIIADEKGNYNIGSLPSKKEVIFYKEDNLVMKAKGVCGVNYLDDNKNDISKEETLANERTSLSKSNCVKINLDVGYDVYLDKNSNYSATEQHISTLFNQMAVLFQNENIRIEISDMWIWTTPDPLFNASDNSARLDLYSNHLSGNFNGNASMYLTNRSNGGIARNNNSKPLCTNKRNKICVSGIWGGVNSLPMFSNPVSIMTHELGHVFGSPHTHDCAWNGNNTVIDGCGGSDNCTDGPIPAVGTIMSYCDLISNGPGISFSAGFGPQPGDKIRTVVSDSTRCIDECATQCMYDAWANSTVSWLRSDTKQVSNHILATNRINAGGKASYSGKSIQLKEGFHAMVGSRFVARVDPCTETSNAVMMNNNSIDEGIENDGVTSYISLYPNPTSDQVTVTSDQAIVFWELFNEIGQTSSRAKVNHQKEFQVGLTHLKKGLYLIRFTMEDGTSHSQKIIKK